MQHTSFDHVHVWLAHNTRLMCAATEYQGSLAASPKEDEGREPYAEREAFAYADDR